MFFYRSFLKLSSMNFFQIQGISAVQRTSTKKGPKFSTKVPKLTTNAKTSKKPTTKPATTPSTLQLQKQAEKMIQDGKIKECNELLRNHGALRNKKTCNSLSEQIKTKLKKDSKCFSANDVCEFCCNCLSSSMYPKKSIIFIFYMLSSSVILAVAPY